MESIQIFNYNNSPVSFSMDDSGVMINATTMAKPFGKRAKDFLKTAQTQEFLATLSEVLKIPSSNFVRVTHGNDGGTWMHEDVAMEFARWLSPMFAIWCNNKIKELMTEGVTALHREHISQIAQQLAKIEGHRDTLLDVIEEKVLLEQHLNDVVSQQQEQIETMTAELQKGKKQKLYTVTEIASELGITARELNIALQEEAIQRFDGEKWVLIDCLQNKGYVRTRYFMQGQNSKRKPNYVPYMTWTEKGREFILDYLTE